MKINNFRAAAALVLMPGTYKTKPLVINMGRIMILQLFKPLPAIDFIKNFKVTVGFKKI